ncbi:MAG TPA: adenylate/guanylate cyclase domain-containing protein [Gaiellaceae bacterium]|nr:adenylate/guanylate cyclase domain-containing protein [Gaiellaceae bacterium]
MDAQDEFRYARSGDVAIAYTAHGEGPRDIVFVHGFASNIQIERETPHARAFHDRISTFGRLIVFDRRGSGLSDRPREAPTLETRMDDVRAVLDAVGSNRAVLFGTFEAAAICMLFAATYPERTLGLVLYNPVARGTWAPDYPWAPRPEELATDDILADWGTYAQAERIVRGMAPTRADDREFVAAQARHLRLSASPGAAATIRRMAADVDVREVLAVIRVPTLVGHMPATREEAEYITRLIPGARRVEVPGPDFLVYFQVDTLLPEVERFLRGLDEREPETVLATVLFTDIVGSTERLAEMGDARWRELVERHHSRVRQQLARFRGEEIDTAGDGFFARFDGPIRAVRCAVAIEESMRDLGLQLRAGLHTGECELVGQKIAGLAVNIGARVAARAGPGEVLVSSTVRDLVAGSDLEFEDRGVAELKGVPGEWRLFAVR